MARADLGAVQDPAVAGGPAGTHVAVSGKAFAPEQEFDLVWRTVKGRWKVTVAEYHGREFVPIGDRIATLKSDKAGGGSSGAPGVWCRQVENGPVRHW